MQIVILVGGLATRLRPLTETLPKAMLPVCGRPFLEHQIDLLRKSGMTQILLCVGYRGEDIEKHFGDGSRFGVRLSYSWEREMLLGTGGALRSAAPLLEDEFLVLYGDSFLMLDYSDVAQELHSIGKPGLMVVHRNEDRYDRSNVILQDKEVVFYSKTERRPGTVYIDAGLSGFRKFVLDLLPQDGIVAMEVLFQRLIARQALGAYETQQRFYEIGSFTGLQEFQELMKASQRVHPHRQA